MEMKWSEKEEVQDCVYDWVVLLKIWVRELLEGGRGSEEGEPVLVVAFVYCCDCYWVSVG